MPRFGQTTTPLSTRSTASSSTHLLRSRTSPFASTYPPRLARQATPRQPLLRSFRLWCPQGCPIVSFPLPSPLPPPLLPFFSRPSLLADTLSLLPRCWWGILQRLGSILTGGKGTPQTLGAALKSVLPTLFPSSRDPVLANVILHGGPVPFRAPLEELMREAAYPDGWLCLCVVLL